MWQATARNFPSLSGALPGAARSAPSIWEDVQTAARQRVNAGSLAIFRIVFGLVGIFIAVWFFAYGWIDEQCIHIFS